jgi:hypothetical protein
MERLWAENVSAFYGLHALQKKLEHVPRDIPRWHVENNVFAVTPVVAL